MQKLTTTTNKSGMFFNIFILILIFSYSESLERFLTDDINSNPIKKSLMPLYNARTFYMKALFGKYWDKDSKEWPLGADTVRSIEPISRSSHRYNIVYDLGVVEKGENILDAEIHVDFGRTFSSRNYNSQRLENSSDNTLPLRCWATFSINGSKQLFDLPLKSLTNLKTAEWWTFDARKVARTWTTSNSKIFDSKVRLSIAFEQSARKQPRKNAGKFLPVHKILRHHQTFLLIFTKVTQKLPTDTNRLLMERIFATKLANQTSGKTSEPQTPLNRAKRYVKPVAQRKPALPSDNRTSYGRRDYYNYYAYSTSDQRQQLAHQPAVHNGKAFDQVIKAVEKYRTRGPTVLEDAKKMRQKTAKNSMDSRRLRYQEVDRFGDDGQKPKKQRRKLTAKKISATRDDKKPQQKDSTSIMENLKKDSKFSACKRHDLIVEFADIGWDDFIIAPKSFEAHYCAGSCDFPLSKNTNPSNHAIIQSIIHAVGLHPNVPGISCAPDKMDSLSLLYQDPHRNVLMLKNYPKMTVKSCGCL